MELSEVLYKALNKEHKWQIEQTKIEAIENMIKLNIPKDKILECYSEEEYNAAIKDDKY